MITSSDFGFVAKFAGIISAIFFSFTGALTIWRIISGRRLYVGDSGFGFGTRDLPPRLVPWPDVEALTIYRMGNQAFVTVTLSDYTAYLSQFSDAAARAELAKFKFIAGMGLAIRPLTHGKIGADLDKTLSANGSVRTLADKMAHDRHTYGGEILLGMYDRDRPPEAFLDLMAGFWERNRASPGDGTV